MLQNKRKILLLFSTFLLIIIFNKCINQQVQKSADWRGDAYAGSSACVACHYNIADNYQHTAHFQTSLPASRQSIKGSFNKDSNTLFYRPALKVVMEQQDSSYYQVAYIDDEEKRKARFDLVIGSGRKGQSYLYWYNENIFQLPVSWFIPGKAWVNSPNFPPENVNFNRNIPIGCFECHNSFIKKTGTNAAANDLFDLFDKNQIIYGIDCERCHGPAAKHAEWQRSNPQEKKPKFIATYASLNRQQQLDMCAMCHSGARQTINSPFFYQPGETQAKYLKADTLLAERQKIDVHGNQYQLLVASKCFLKTNTLTCTTCHAPHLQERDNLLNFSKKCLSCHSDTKHNDKTLAATKGLNLANNCIDCHMPAKPSAIITMKSASHEAHATALVRTHYISIYPDETKGTLQKIK